MMTEKLNYVVSGTGQCIVLLHGLMEDFHVWDEFATQLSEYFQVICIDLPGHGKSPVYSEIHTMDFMAKCVNDVLEENNIGKCVMAGHSMGGYVTLAFAKHFPEKLRGICLMNSQALPDTEEGKQNRDRAVTAILDDKAQFIARFMRKLFTPEHQEQYKTQIDALIERAKKMEPRAIAAVQLGMKERASSLAVLMDIHVPVLFIAGKQDPVIPIDKVMGQAMIPQHSEVLILGNTAHMAFLEAKQESLDMLESFADRCFSY